MLDLPGLNRRLPAVIIPLRKTNADNAWQGERFTVRLIADLPALRVHAKVNARGRWFAIGDVILTREEYQSAHALPDHFSHQDEWLLPHGTILNVGVCSPLFNHAGGASQAERLAGPPPQRREFRGYWASRWGNA